MKPLLLACIVLLFMCGSTAVAQNVTPKDKSGDKALVFSINGFGNFGVGGVPVGTTTVIGFGTQFDASLPGAGIKYYMSDRVAIRAGVGLRTASTSSDDTTGADTSVTSFGIGPGIEFHLVNAGPVSGYVGAALGFSSNSVKVEGRAPGSPFESTLSSSSFGIMALLGAEFFPWSNISLGAEFTAGFSSDSRSSKTTIGTVSSETDLPGLTSIGIGSAAVFLGIYF